MAQARISFIDTAAGGALTFPGGAYLVVTGAAAISAAAPTFGGTGSIEIVPDVTCRVAIGTTPNRASDAAVVLRAGQRYEAPITAGQKVAFEALSANPIQFPATAIPSSDPNALDDYREGTFAPVIASSGTAATGVTYGEQTGNFVKVGRPIFLSGRVTLTLSGTGSTDNAQIAGFPVTLVGLRFTTQFRPSGLTLPASTILGALVANDRLYLQSVRNDGANDVTYASLDNGFDAIFSAIGIALA